MCIYYVTLLGCERFSGAKRSVSALKKKNAREFVLHRV